MLTGESRFHISTPLGIEPGSLMTGIKGWTHWTSETVCECSEIAGSPQHPIGRRFFAASFYALLIFFVCVSRNIFLCDICNDYCTYLHGYCNQCWFAATGINLYPTGRVRVSQPSKKNGRCVERREE
jgi:hypothetical protein